MRHQAAAASSTAHHVSFIYPPFIIIARKNIFNTCFKGQFAFLMYVLFPYFYRIKHPYIKTKQSLFIGKLLCGIMGNDWPSLGN